MPTRDDPANTKIAMDDQRSIPREIGGYRIIEVLGEGGMSVVYTALQDHPRRKVALKVLRGGLYSPTAVRRFHQEVEILGKLDHPWIAKIYEAGMHDDGNGATPYYVMEHVADARELGVFLKEESLVRREVLKLFTMISSAVEHGHHRGIVHRDLKPGNILVDSNNEPKIIDFGVARSLDRSTVNEKAMTEAGRLVGTVQFMAPEQVDPSISDIDARCDVYALGVVLYQMLTSRLPRTLEGLPIYEAVRQICKEAPVRPTVYDETIDQDLEAIIMKSLETDRQNRYQTAGAFGRDVLRYLGNLPIKARKTTTVGKATLFCKRHSKQLLIWGSVALMVGALVWGVQDWKTSSANKMEQLQTQVDSLNKEREVLENTPPVAPIVNEQVTTSHTLPGTPREIVVSADGTTLVATLEDEFHASTIDGNVFALPPINIEPSEASIGLSIDGSLFAIVSRLRCRVVFLREQRSSLRLTGQFNNITALAVSTTGLAITLDDMSMQFISDNNTSKRALSTSGVFKVVSFDRTGQMLIAATDHKVYVWDTKEFPRGKRTAVGVNDPCLIGFSYQNVVVVGSNGQVITYTPDLIATKRLSLRLGGTITSAAFNVNATVLGCIVNEKAYRCDLSTGELEEVTWMPEIPVGMAIRQFVEPVLWTSDGEVFQQE